MDSAVLCQNDEIHSYAKTYFATLKVNTYSRLQNKRKEKL